MRTHRTPFPNPREGRKSPKVEETKVVETAKIEEEIDLIIEPEEEAEEVEETSEESTDGNS